MEALDHELTSTPRQLRDLDRQSASWIWDVASRGSLLTYILVSEGYAGHGFSARARVFWYHCSSATHLHVCAGPRPHQRGRRRAPSLTTPQPSPNTRTSSRPGCPSSRRCSSRTTTSRHPARVNTRQEVPEALMVRLVSYARRLRFGTNLLGGSGVAVSTGHPTKVLVSARVMATQGRPEDIGRHIRTMRGGQTQTTASTRSDRGEVFI